MSIKTMVSSLKNELKFKWLEIKDVFKRKILPVAGGKLKSILGIISVLFLVIAVPVKKIIAIGRAYHRLKQRFKTVMRLLVAFAIITFLLILVAWFFDWKLQMHFFECNGHKTAKTTTQATQTTPLIQKGDASLKRNIVIDPKDNVPKVSYLKFGPSKKDHVLGENADPSWKVLLMQGGKRGNSIDKETLKRWKAELSQMRYLCFGYYNEGVEVNCWQYENFCDVSFASTVNDKGFRMYFRSKVSHNGFDEITDWKIYSVDGIHNLRRKSRVDLVDQILLVKPICNPFSTK
ncbi:MAG: hypothetical protein WC663_00020 [Patescibacteria group bacterium]|jgi:hypothetical protein